MNEKTSPLHRGVRWLQDLFLTSKGLMIGDARLYGKRDPNNNFDIYWKRKDGTDVNLTGDVLQARATSSRTLTTSYQTVIGDGDSNNVRLLLPTIGEWWVHLTIDIEITTTGVGDCWGALFVNDSGSPETGLAIFRAPDDPARGSPGQDWKITTTAANTPVELKVKKAVGAGAAAAKSGGTVLTASIGAGGGSTVETVDHGTLAGRGDYDHDQYLRNDGSILGSTGQAQDFGSAGIKANAIAESTGAAGVTMGSDVIVASGKDLTLVSGTLDIDHTAAENDDHGVEIDLDAAGFGDVKALDITYDTGDIVSGEDEAIILVDINEFDAGGGDVFGLEVLSTDGGADAIYAIKAGAVVGPVLQESGTFANPNTATNDTATTNVANMKDGSTGTSTTIFVADDDYIIIGDTNPFTEIEFNIETVAANPGIRPTFEYSKAAGAWSDPADFSPVDGTNGFRNSGVIAWDAADLTDHAVHTSGGDPGDTYDIRITRTHAVAGSVSLFYAKTAETVVYSWDEDGDLSVKTLDTSGNITVGGTVDGVDIAARDHAKYTDNEAVTAVANADDYLKNDANDETSGDLTVANLITAGNVDGVDISAWIDQDVSSGSAPTFAQAITDNHVVTIDGTANDTEHAVFNAAGLEGLTDTELLAALSGDAGAAFDWGGQDLINLGVIFLTEQAAAEADVANKGQIWVKTGAPNTLWFTNEDGDDVQLGAAGHAKYTDAEAITAVEGEATLDLAGEVTIASGKDLTLKTDGSSGGLKFGAAGDVLLYRISLNELALASGDSLRLRTDGPGGSLFFGATPDVQLYRGAANKLYLASGDSLEIVSGDLGVTGAITGTTIGGITEANLVDKSASEAIAGKWAFSDYITFVEIAAPGGDPADTQSWLYTKADGAVQKLYFEQQDGTVTDLLAGGGGGTPTLIEDADQNTKVQTEEGADENIIRMDVAGTERFLLKDTDSHLTITGNSAFIGTVGIAGAGTTANELLINRTANIAPAGFDYFLMQMATAGTPDLTKNMAQLGAFGIEATYDLAKFDCSAIAGIFFIMAVSDVGTFSSAAVDLFTTAYFEGTVGTGGGGSTRSMGIVSGIYLIPPAVGNQWGTTGTHRGLYITSSGVISTTGTTVPLHVGLDIESQSTGATTDYSIRVVGTAASIHQPAMAIGANAAPAATLDITQAGASAAIPVLELDQDDTSEPFIDFVGTSTADANSSISSLNTSGATTDHIQIDLNGAKAWIAVSTNAPS